MKQRQIAIFFSCPAAVVAQSVMAAAGDFDIMAASHQALDDGSVWILLVIKGDVVAIGEHEKRVAKIIEART